MNAAQDQSIHDIIIVGAGPVGLFLACELALAKCSVLVLEKSANPQSPLKQIPFGIRGLSAPTIETLDRRGLLDQLEIHKRLKSPHQNPGQGSRRQVGHFAGIPFHDGDVDTTQWKYRLPTSTDTSLISEIQELETIFTRRAESLGVEIKRGSGVTDFQQTNDEVIVQSNEQSFRGKWLVGCDGGRSIIRKLGGFEFAGTDPEFTGYSTSVDIADPEKLKPGRNVTAKGMYLQSQPGYVIIQDFDNGEFHSSGNPITREHIQNVLRKVSDTNVTITTLHHATNWTDRCRQATAYRKGRVLLAGDAAHIHSPLGGQGLNLGIGDAMNLGWKLAATIKSENSEASESLLDTYYSERHPVGAQVLNWSRAQVAIMRPDEHARALNSIVRDLLNTRDGATYMASRVWGINTEYDLGGNHPLIGRSVPNFKFEDGSTVNEMMRDGKEISLDFDVTPVKDTLGLKTLSIRPDGIVAKANSSGNSSPYQEQ